MKKLISMTLVLLLTLSLIPSAAAVREEATEAADILYMQGLFKGTGTNKDGSPIYNLDAVPTRNQAIIMLVRLLGKEEEALAGTWDIPFTDVADSMRPYIGYAYANGLTNGYTATTYCGTNPVRFNQYITFVLRALGYESGKDFEVGSSWEFSDKIGLTDGAYSADTKQFTRGDVAVISRAALSVCLKGSSDTLLERLEEEGAAGRGKYTAWYEVDEMGRLHLRTDVPGNTESGYWVLVETKFRNGSVSHDSQEGRRSVISYEITSMLSYWESSIVVDQINLYIFRDHTGREKFWNIWEELNSKEKALEAFREDLVVRLALESDIFTENKKDAFGVTSLSVVRNEAAQEETYTACISSEIMERGEYGIVYEGKTGGQYAGMSYIGRGNGCLTFTREIDHFADPGASGTFYITHSEFRQQEDGNIVCSNLWSTGYPYQLGT